MGETGWVGWRVGWSGVEGWSWASPAGPFAWNPKQRVGVWQSRPEEAIPALAEHCLTVREHLPLGSC